MSKNCSFQRALDYIEDNITKNISLYDIACEAGFSVPHFYRLFKRLTGDTVYEYILRRKIAMTAKDLTDSNKSIGRIAFEYGFESHDVFTRAFKRIYGMVPSAYRRCNMPPPPLKRLTIINNNSVFNKRQMSFRVLNVDSFCVIGMECIAEEWDSDGAIGRLWSNFLSRIDKIENFSVSAMYGICENETCKNGKFKYMAAIGIEFLSRVPCGMVKRVIRAQKFFEACVPEFINTPDAYTSAADYAKSLGYEVENYDDIEIYEDSFKDPDVNNFKLLIPIK